MRLTLVCTSQLHIALHRTKLLRAACGHIWAKPPNIFVGIALPLCFITLHSLVHLST